MAELSAARKEAAELGAQLKDAHAAADRTSEVQIQSRPHRMTCGGIRATQPKRAATRSHVTAGFRAPSAQMQP